MGNKNKDTNALIPLIDGDLVVYRCGFSAKDSEDLSHVLGRVKKTMEKILSRFPDAPEYHLFITGDGNYRAAAASLLPYKGNRDPNAKPKYFHEIRDYLVRVWDAKLIEGKEADDAIGCLQMKLRTKSVIVSIDKDLDMIPGYHYNWVKHSLYYQSKEEADLWFWTQMMTGDRVDNIPGIYGVGKKTALKIIEEERRDIQRIKKRVGELYEKQYGDDWVQAMGEVGTLLWIQREDDNYNWWRYF